jgi:hypothetical protein
VTAPDTHDAAPWLGRQGHFGQRAAPVPCGFGPNSGPGQCAGFIFFLFFYQISNFRKNRIWVQKCLQNEIQLKKMQYKFWINPQE